MRARPPDPAGTRDVVLLHGVWLQPWIMRPLARRLRACGLRCHRFGYPSVRLDLDANARRLRAFIADRGLHAPHFVGHSLGGLVLCRTFDHFPALGCGRVVLLGAPLAGSRVARRLADGRLTRRLLGRSLGQALDAREPCRLPPCEVGMLAGTRPLGVGRVFAVLPAANDGTVAVDETRLPGLAAHLCLPVTHTGMLFSGTVADQVCHFLLHGVFQPV